MFLLNFYDFFLLGFVMLQTSDGIPIAATVNATYIETRGSVSAENEIQNLILSDTDILPDISVRRDHGKAVKSRNNKPIKLKAKPMKIHKRKPWVTRHKEVEFSQPENSGISKVDFHSSASPSVSSVFGTAANTTDFSKHSESLKSIEILSSEPSVTLTVEQKIMTTPTPNPARAPPQQLTFSLTDPKKPSSFSNMMKPLKPVSELLDNLSNLTPASLMESLNMNVNWADPNLNVLNPFNTSTLDLNLLLPINSTFFSSFSEWAPFEQLNSMIPSFSLMDILNPPTSQSSLLGLGLLSPLHPLAIMNPFKPSLLTTILNPAAPTSSLLGLLAPNKPLLTVSGIPSPMSIIQPQLDRLQAFVKSLRLGDKIKAIIPSSPK